MTPEEREEFNRLEEKLDSFLDIYYRTHHLDFSEFRDRVYFNNDVYLPSKIAFFGDNTTVAKQTAITAPTGGGDAGVDTPARNAINDIITKLQSLGLTL